MSTATGSLNSDATPVPCAICDGRETQTLWIKSGYAIGRCVSCGLIYANPRAPHATILARYSSDYFWHEYLPSLGVNEGHFDLTTFDARYGAMLGLIAADKPPSKRLLEVGSGAGFFSKPRNGQAGTSKGLNCRKRPHASRPSVCSCRSGANRPRPRRSPVSYTHLTLPTKRIV